MALTIVKVTILPLAIKKNKIVLKGQNSWKGVIPLALSHSTPLLLLSPLPPISVLAERWNMPGTSLFKTSSALIPTYNPGLLWQFWELCYFFPSGLEDFQIDEYEIIIRVSTWSTSVCCQWNTLLIEADRRILVHVSGCLRIPDLTA